MPAAFASPLTLLPTLGVLLRRSALSARHPPTRKPRLAHACRTRLVAASTGPTQPTSTPTPNPKPKPSRTRRMKNMAIAANAADEAAMLRKGALIAAKLSQIYPVAPTGFLTHSDPFTLLVAVLLSAQSLDTKVNAVTPALFRAAPTPSAMRRLGESRIRALIREVGLSPQKAANLARLSAIVDDEHDGVVPRSFAELERLPGVGHKTASVVMMQAFGHPAFPVDTHIHRLACRWGCGDARSVERTETALKAWFPDQATWHHLHTRIILFGREHCAARKHDMQTCPVCSFAATDEARVANNASPNKFVAAKTHSNPFAVRDGGDGGVEGPQGGERGLRDDASDADFEPATKKRKRATPAVKKVAPRKRKPRAAATRKQPKHSAVNGNDGEDDDGEDDDDEGDTKALAKRKETTRSRRTANAGNVAKKPPRADASPSASATGSGQADITGAVRTSARIRARTAASSRSAEAHM